MSAGCTDDQNDIPGTGAVGHPGMNDKQEGHDQEKHDCDEQRLTMSHGPDAFSSYVQIYPNHVGAGN
jgi:hypothetical protein